jgi:hypothetical protein
MTLPLFDFYRARESALVIRPRFSNLGGLCGLFPYCLGFCWKISDPGKQEVGGVLVPTSHLRRPNTPWELSERNFLPPFYE